MTAEFRIPELGENIKGGDVVKINVAPGDRVVKDQPVIEIETDKAVIEVPSTLAGVVREVLVQVGQKAQVGQAVLVLDGADPADAATHKAPDAAPLRPQAPAVPPSREETRAAASPAPAPTLAPAGRAESPDESANSPRSTLAAPSVRKLAREIGVDVESVTGSGPGGRVTLDDVKGAARRAKTDSPAARASSAAAAELPDFSRFGAVERKPMTSVRRKTAERMTHAWLTIPHVTQHDDADITEVENLRRQFGKRAEAAGGNLTVTVILLKIVAAALKVFPQFNASVDMTSQEIIYKKYVNIGVAVDTDRGLIVPVIRDVDKKNIVRLSVELNESAERARAKKTALEEMQGGSFTITNLGGIGGGHFTPIINPPEVAILGAGRWRHQQVYAGGGFEARKILPLSLSYDHRVIDGADAARFLRWIVEAVNEPFLMDLEG